MVSFSMCSLQLTYFLAKGLNQVEIGREFFGTFVQTHGVDAVTSWFIQLYRVGSLSNYKNESLFQRLPTYLQTYEASGLNRAFVRPGNSFITYFFQVSV